jgi:hypothetical protein
MNTKYLSCDEFSARKKVKAASVRSRISRTGSYYGAKPIRAPNGRLLFIDDNDEEVTHSVEAEVQAASRAKKAVAARRGVKS